MWQIHNLKFKITGQEEKVSEIEIILHIQRYSTLHKLHTHL